MEYTHKNHGTCSSATTVELDENNIIRSVAFCGGCPGNTQGVSRLCLGRPAEEVIGLLAGVRCGTRPTSCPDQLAETLREAVAANHS